MKSVEILILGGGPTGLGAAHRLEELEFTDWLLLEQANHLGGLAGSEVDDQGFVWDFGGHVLFSHYEYFDNLLDDLLDEQWIHHEREAWIWMRERWIPYPFQNNLWRLPSIDLEQCVQGLETRQDAPDSSEAQNFDDWILSSFGEGIADTFMRPYNFKVWAYPTDHLSTDWTGERVAEVDKDRILADIHSKTDRKSWGPNSVFRFPKSGGTGSIWRELGNRLPQGKIEKEMRVSEINPENRIVTCESGESFEYGKLISTIPITNLLKNIHGEEELQSAASSFKWSSTHVVGIGIDGKAPEDLKSKCWMYFPEDNVPFYRATVFSNYAPANVPRPGKQWSLMCEISESSLKPVNHDEVILNSIDGLKEIGLISENANIVSTWKKFLPYGYPTPFIGRDEILETVDRHLKKLGIFSRGRFGGWKYEVSNQDHSLMQGVECINALLLGETEFTYYFPEVANKRN
ncbi:MAG: amine oxidase [Acidimicrobiaceae bacterium]|nr:amine oxidase [Acidimicrobiaceae bacterium]